MCVHVGEFFFFWSVHVGIVGVFLLYITYMYIHVSWYIFLRLFPHTFFFFCQHMQLTFVGNLYS